MPLKRKALFPQSKGELYFAVQRFMLNFYRLNQAIANGQR
jgi:hypothetical protein